MNIDMAGSIFGKVWGTTSTIFSCNNVEVCRIEGIRGGKSSMHKHISKVSQFFVESGSIAVYIEKSYNLTDMTILKPGQLTVVQPDEFHRFEILEDKTVCYEFYWTVLDHFDIIRKDCGSLGSILQDPA